MNLDPTRFDERIVKLQKAYLIAMLFGDKPHPDQLTRQVVSGDWKARFRNAEWDAFVALSTLGLAHVDTPIGDVDQDTCEGVTGPTGVWLRPDALHPVKVAAHEMAHNVLGHITNGQKNFERLQQIQDFAKTLWDHTDDRVMVKSIGHAMADAAIGVVKSREETEAELVGYLVADALGCPDGDPDAMFHWTLGYLSQNMPVVMVDTAKVKQAAQQILSAGMVALRKAA